MIILLINKKSLSCTSISMLFKVIIIKLSAIFLFDENLKLLSVHNLFSKKNYTISIFKLDSYNLFKQNCSNNLKIGVMHI